jgi:hypothetical protein
VGEEWGRWLLWGRGVMNWPLTYRLHMSGEHLGRCFN